MTVFRDGVLYPGRIGMLVFVGGGEPDNPKKKLRNKERTNTNIATGGIQTLATWPDRWKALPQALRSGRRYVLALPLFQVDFVFGHLELTGVTFFLFDRNLWSVTVLRR